MKRLLFALFAVFVFAFGALAQAPTVGAGNSGAWLRTGNNAAPNNGNVIGTFFSSTFYAYTDSLLRLRVNDNLTSIVNGQPAVARNGFVGIGHNPNQPQFWWDVPSNPGPYSLLHLNGDGSGAQALGYRNWMRGGITITSNDDLAYIGHKPNSLDVTDLVFAWSDNAGPSQYGPDNLTFVFTSADGAANYDLNGDHPNGREILRMTGEGNVGIGPRFNNAAQPQSMLHLNAPDANDATLQLTSQSNGQSANDGLKLTVSGANRDAYINQQEDASIIVFTGSNAGSGGERMRVTNAGPSGLSPNLTRVGISHGPGSMTAPRSVLHLGTNLTASNNGWRPWMDIGTLTTATSDHLYVGLKAEQPTVNSLGDRQDAVIAWGDNGNPASLSYEGPDYLRFIFTTTTTDPWNAAARSANGREIMRLTPSGQAGIGDWPNLAPPIGATLDIAGDLRIRTIPQDNNLTHILVADPADENRVHWRDASTLLASQFFACPTSVPADKLPYDSWWELNDFSFVFAGQGGTKNSVGIGTSCTPGAKLHVNRQLVSPAMILPVAIRADHNDVSSNGPFNGFATGILSTITGQNAMNVAGDFAAQNAIRNIAVRGVSSNGQSHIGGYFVANGTTASNIGVYGSAPTLGWAGVFSGRVFASGGYFPTSDRRIKRDIQPITKALDTINRLQPRTYFFDPAAEPRLSLPRERQYGLVAQDLEKVLPELVTDLSLPAVEENQRDATVKSVNYNALIGIILAGMQEQQREIRELRAKVEQLSKK